MKDKLLQIIEHYGINEQLKYIHSEYFELDEAIVQYDWNSEIYDESVAKKCVVEEIADVLVMLKQFQYYFNISDEEIAEVMRYKIKRQIERIESE